MLLQDRQPVPALFMTIIIRIIKADGAFRGEAFTPTRARTSTRQYLIVFFTSTPLFVCYAISLISRIIVISYIAAAHLWVTRH